MIRAALFASLLAAPAGAQELAAAHQAIDCYCTDRHGERVDLGGYTCIQVGEQPYMARCEMVLNNPAWRKIQDGCVSSGLQMSPWLDPQRG